MQVFRQRGGIGPSLVTFPELAFSLSERSLIVVL